MSITPQTLSPIFGHTLLYVCLLIGHHFAFWTLVPLFCLTWLIFLHSCSWASWFDSTCFNLLFGLHIQQIYLLLLFSIILRSLCQLLYWEISHKKKVPDHGDKWITYNMVNHNPWSCLLFHSHRNTVAVNLSWQSWQW